MPGMIKKMRKEKKSKAAKLDQDRSRNVFRQLAAEKDGPRKKDKH